MRVTLTIDGGLAHMPGLAKPITVDAAQLSADDAATLRRLCDAVPATAYETPASQREVIPDGRRYRLTIERGNERRRLDAADPIDHPAIAELITFVRKRGTRGN